MTRFVSFLSRIGDVLNKAMLGHIGIRFLFETDRRVIFCIELRSVHLVFALRPMSGYLLAYDKAWGFYSS